jgi:hypothetical protein
MYSLNLKLPGLPNITSNGPHGSWRAKAASVRIWKNAVRMALAAHHELPEKPLANVRIVMTRHSSLEPDPDNLGISFKACLDALKVDAKSGFAGVIVDDKRIHIGKPEYLWKYAPRIRGFVTIEVYEVTEDMQASV